MDSKIFHELTHGHVIRRGYQDIGTEYGITNGIPVIRYNKEFCVNMFGNECEFTPMPQDIDENLLMEIAVLFSLAKGFHQVCDFGLELGTNDERECSSIFPVVTDDLRRYFRDKKIKIPRKRIRVTLTRIS